MRVIILAAGTGSRLKPFTDDQPKPLVQLAGKPLIRHTLDTIAQLTRPADRGITIVGGYLIENMRDYLRNSLSPLLKKNITILENTRYSEGNLITLLTAIEHLDGDTLIMNADHIYPVELLNAFLDGDMEDIRIACDFDRTLIHDDMKVLLDNKGHLSKIHKKLDSFNCGYIGMTYIPENMINSYRDAIFNTHRIFGNSAVVEFVLGYLADSDYPPMPIDLSGFGWLEIDSKEDLARAEKCYNNGDFMGFWKT